MSAYERIRKAMVNRGVSAYKVSKDTGITQASFSRWKSGIDEPSIKTIQILAEYLEVSTDWICGLEEKDITEKKIPVLGSVPCGDPFEAVEDIVEWIDVVPVMQKGHFGLIAKGNSMYPYIMNKDILIIKQTEDVDNGKIAVVKVNGDEATCKKVLKGPHTLTLVPLNKDYDPITFTEEEVETKPVKIIGEVVEIRRRF